MIHNRYLQGGGEDVSAATEADLLTARGHYVETLVDDNSRVASLGRARVAVRTVWSHEAYTRVGRTLAQSRFDIVSVQNFFPLFSPAVYYAARRQGVPVVQTLRNYRLLCPNALLFRDDHVCEDCLGHPIPFPSLRHKCYRGSLMATGAVSAMLTVHRLVGSWRNMVDHYVVLSEFMREKCVANGLPAERISVKPNFVWPDPGPGVGGGGFALFAGRLSREKGVRTLLKAWTQVHGGLQLRVAGDGPLAGDVVRASELDGSIVWLGRRSWPEILSLLGQAEFVIMPSECYESFGRVVIEAYAKGTPVVGVDLGAVSELISHCRTGRLFRAGDPSDLAKSIDWMIEHADESLRMRSESRAEYEDKYTGERNGEMLEIVFQRAIEHANRRKAKMGKL
jgi:glycosyltransferase involved in cell wall biosynthesis